MTVFLAVEVHAEKDGGELPSVGPKPRELLLELAAVELVALAPIKPWVTTVVVYSQLVIRSEPTLRV